MKLNYRDKVLLIAVLVILVWVAGIMLFIKPAFEDLDTAKKELNTKTVELDQKQKQVKDDEDLPNRVEKAYDEVTEIRSNFYSKLTTDEVSETIDNLLDTDNITNDSLTISAYSSVVLQAIVANTTEMQTPIDELAQRPLDGAATPTDTAADANADGTAVVSVTVPSYSVNFGFNCKLEDLQNFLDKLTTNTEKSLVVTNCNITDVNADNVEGTMQMVLMMMPELKNPLEEDADNDKAADESKDDEKDESSEADE